MLHSCLPTETVGTLMKTNRVLKEMKADLVELWVHAHRKEKLAAVIWSDTAWANRTRSQDIANLASLKIEGQGEIHSERRGASTADAEELYFTRLRLAQFMGLLVNVSNVDKTVQRVDRGLVIDAKAIYDSMCGAHGGKEDGH